MRKNTETIIDAASAALYLLAAILATTGNDHAALLLFVWTAAAHGSFYTGAGIFLRIRPPMSPNQKYPPPLHVKPQRAEAAAPSGKIVELDAGHYIYINHVNKTLLCTPRADLTIQGNALRVGPYSTRGNPNPMTTQVNAMLDKYEYEQIIALGMNRKTEEELLYGE